MPEPTILVVFATSLLVALSGALVPGPMLTVSVSHTLRRGFWAGPLVTLGHGILELALVVALVLGLSRFLQGPSITASIGILGGAVLLVMALLMGRDALRVAHSLTFQARPPATHLVPLSGIVSSLANPYWLLWWATIGATYALWSWQIGWAGVAAFFTGHILGDLAWYSFVSFLIATGRKMFRDLFYRVVLGLCSVFLAGLGGYFIYSGATSLLRGAA